MAAEISKPDFSYQWSSGGSIVAPSNVKIQTGWTAEVPPFQWENYLQNRQDNAILHLFQKGISEWDAVSNYYFTTSGVRSYVQGSDGLIYVAVQDSVGQNPTTDVSDTYWKVAFADNSTALTTTTGDARYTQRANNLSDLANVATARTNLSVYSKVESDSLLPQGYFFGFAVINNAGAPNTTADIGSGTARDSTNTFNIPLPSTFSGILQTSGAWAAGTGQNKLDTGAKAINSTYHVFAIRKTSDGTGDILFSLSPTAPTMPSGYAGFRRIPGARLITDASGNIVPFKYRGIGCYDLATPNIEATATVAPSAFLLSLRGMGGIPVKARLNMVINGDGAAIKAIPTDVTEQATSTAFSAYTGGIAADAGGGSAGESGAGQVDVVTDASGQVRIRIYTGAGNGSYRAVLMGWEESL